jgi:23S rRNA (guanosine2251-2'-O)-methyltransferase
MQTDGGVWLYGLHAVAAALGNPNRHRRRLLATAQGRDALKATGVADFGAAVQVVERSEIEARLPPGAVHQGVALLADPLAEVPLPEVCAGAAADARVVVLDQATDPRNVGAVLRAAAAFGATAVIAQSRHAPEATGALAKAASGALETVPLIRVANLARALEKLKDAEFWCVGLDGGAEGTIAEALPRGRVALVLGAEGAGLRRLTRETCDELARIPITDTVESLNVAAAAAVALYEVVRGTKD